MDNRDITTNYELRTRHLGSRMTYYKGFRDIIEQADVKCLRSQPGYPNMNAHIKPDSARKVRCVEKLNISSPFWFRMAATAGIQFREDGRQFTNKT
jgi:hypothetical protein